MIIWVLADDRAGNVGQCLGVAEALGLPFETKEIRYTVWAGLPNSVLGASLVGVTSATRQGLVPPWPDLVIAAGRRTAPVARWIRRNHPAARLVQIMDPGPGGRREFTLLAVPTGDRLSRSGWGNVLPILGAPHRVTEHRLAAAAERWRPQFADLPHPWVAVIVGGATKGQPFTAAIAEDLAQQVQALVKEGGTVLLTTSRRTGAEAAAVLKQHVRPPHVVHVWGESPGENPYFGFLALADAVVVTGDSVSMCCEACATSVPVYLYAPDGQVRGKHARLHADLYAKGLARPLSTADLHRDGSHPPLNAAGDVAQAIRTVCGIGTCTKEG